MLQKQSVRRQNPIACGMLTLKLLNTQLCDGPLQKRRKIENELTEFVRDDKFYNPKKENLAQRNKYTCRVLLDYAQ